PTGSVLVVVAMAALQRLDADVPAIGVAREEVVAEEVARRRAGLPRAVVGRAHVRDAEPHDEATARADLRRRPAVAAIVERELRVLRVEPRGEIGRASCRER